MPNKISSTAHHPTNTSRVVSQALGKKGFTVRQFAHAAEVAGYHIADNTIHNLLNGQAQTISPSTAWIIHKVTDVPMADLLPGFYGKPQNDLWQTLLEVQTRQRLSAQEMATKLDVFLTTYRNAITGGKIQAPTIQRIRQKLGLPVEPPTPQPAPAPAPVVATPPPPPPQPPVAPVAPVVAEETPAPVPEPKPKPNGEEEYQSQLALMHWTLVQALRYMVEMVPKRRDHDEWEIATRLADAISEVTRDNYEVSDRAKLLLQGLEILIDPKSKVEQHALQLMRLMAFVSQPEIYRDTTEMEEALVVAFQEAMGRRKELQL